MMKRVVSIGAILVLSSSAFSATLSLYPKSQTTDTTCTVSVGAADLAGIKGMDIVIQWNSTIASCSGARLVPGALPEFAVFLNRVDNRAGSLEVVLLKQSAGGYTGSAEPFLALTFEPVATGTTQVVIKKSGRALDPLLIDEGGAAVDAAVDTATVIVVSGTPPPAITAAKLHQNYPNPFNPATTIRFDVPSPSPVTLRVYDVNGRLVQTLINGAAYASGSWTKEWNGRNDRGILVPSGVYVCVLGVSGKRLSTKVVVLR